MTEWAQYYTPSEQSKRLIGLLPHKAGQYTIKSIFDLGAGRGDLLAAAGLRWPKAQLYAVDIDVENVVAMQARFPTARCLTTDALKYDLPRRLGLNEGSADIAVANPPYGSLQSETDALRLLRHVGLADVVNPKRMNREVIFLAQNLRFLRKGGALIAIVPEGLGSCTHFDELRLALMQRHGLFKAIELPSNTFSGTEVKTLALFMVKEGAVEKLTWTSVDGYSVELTQEQVRVRLDGQFHQLQERSGDCLADVGADIRRGNIAQTKNYDLASSVFHTTHFQRYKNGLINFSRQKTTTGNKVLAEQGDILIARVGTRCIGRVGWVKSGEALITDCVYRIRVKPEIQELVFENLRSQRGQGWLKTVAHGTCAQFLSKADLLTFPIFLKP